VFENLSMMCTDIDIKAAVKPRELPPDNQILAFLGKRNHQNGSMRSTSLLAASPSNLAYAS